MVKNICSRIQNRKLKDQVSIQDTQIQALQDSLREIEEQAVQQQQNNRIVADLMKERDDLRELVSKVGSYRGPLLFQHSI